MSRAFFEDLGYLFVEWKGPEKVYNISQKNVVLSWAAAYAPKKVRRTEDIDACVVRGEGTGDPTDKNIELYKALVDDTPELILLIKHDVMVHNGMANARRFHAGSNRNTFPHHRHLMDVAVRLIGSFAHVRPKHRRQLPLEVLGAHSNALAVVYHIAVAFRVILSGQTVSISGAKSVSIANADEADVLPSLPDGVAQAFISRLFPAPTVMTAVLTQVIGSVPKDVFEEQRLDAEQKEEGTVPQRPSDDVPDDDASLEG